MRYPGKSGSGGCCSTEMSWLGWLSSVFSDERIPPKNYGKLFLYFPLVCPLPRFLGHLLNPKGLGTCQRGQSLEFSSTWLLFSWYVWSREKTWAKNDWCSMNLLMAYTFIKVFLFKNYLYPQVFLMVAVNCSIFWPGT